MRVLHLLGSQEDTGGVLTTVRNLQETTRSSGWTHLSWVHQQFQETRQPPLDLRFSKFLVMEHPSYPVLLWRGLRAFLELRKFLSHEPCDVLHAHSRGPLVVVMIASVLLGRRVLFTNHAFARNRWFYRWVSHWPNVSTTVLTPGMADYYGMDLKHKRIHVISECCSDRFLQGPIRLPRNRSADYLRFVGLGNLIRWKKRDLLIEAVGQLKPEIRSRFSIDIFGPTPQDADSIRYSEELAAGIKAKGLSQSIRLRGSTRDVLGELQNADLFILPSTHEPCSLALIEALAQGIPALVSRSGGNMDIVQDRVNGLQFSPDDPSSLAAALEEFVLGCSTLVSPAEIRESVRNRCATKVAGQLLPIYLTLAESTFA